MPDGAGTTAAPAPAAAPQAGEGAPSPGGEQQQAAVEQAGVENQATAEKPAELTDKPANQDEAAHEKAARELLGGEAPPESEGEKPAEEAPREEKPAEDESETEAAPEASEGEPAPEEASEGEPTEEAEPKEGVISIASGLFPEQEFKSENEAADAITNYVNESREYRERQETATKRLAELFRGNPDLVDVIHLMNEGAPYREAHDFVFGEQTETDVEKAKEGWRKTAAEKKQAREAQEKSLKETAKNLEVSMSNVKQFAQENNLSDDEVSEFLNTLDDIMGNISKGNITGDIMTKLLKGVRHDKVVKDESEKAEIRGRNEAIKERVAKTDDKKKGDGIPHPKGQGVEKAEEAPAKEDPADILGRNIDHLTGSRRF